MSDKAVHCGGCGAGMLPAGDGRTFGCRYCGAQMQVAVDAEQLAAGMKLDFSNATAFLHRLAQALESAVADRTKVQRQGRRSSPSSSTSARRVRREARSALRRSAQHKKVVRGIALKTATHPLDRWVDDGPRGARGSRERERARDRGALTSSRGMTRFAR